MQIAFGQFSSTTSVTVGGNLAYQNNGINVTGMGNLDGINLGVTSIELAINITTNGGAFPELDLYLVAPGGLAVFILSNDITANGTYIFNSVVPQGTIKYAARTPGTYRTFGDLNSLNLNQTANGLWRLYAKQSRALYLNATITSWKITFGNTDIYPGAPNQSLATAIPLINTTATGNFISSYNRFHGLVMGDARGSDVDNTNPLPLTETSVWYSFVPKCANDKIEISGPNGYTESWINANILTSSRTSTGTPKEFFNSTVTFSPTFVPGNTYYLVMDGSEADFFAFQVKWFEGTCTPPTITTTNQPVTDYCLNSPIAINFTTTGTFNAGNRFTAQLSDTLGSFTNPLVLGFKDATVPSVINGTLPAGLKPGKSYKIRVVSSAPAITGSVNSGITIKGPPAAPVSFLTEKNPVCSGEKNIKYHINAVPDALKYRWKFSGGAQIISATTSDSISVLVDFGSVNSNVTISAVNECGNGPAYQQTIIVTQPSTPTISINTVPTTICQGDSVKLQASFTNEGTSPVFNWKVNNQDYGSGTPAITVKSLKNKDSVWVVLTSNQTCISSPTALSGKLIFMVRDTVKPFVNLTGNTILCSGSFTTLSASTKNKGTNPVFNWYVNNVLQNNVPDSTFKTNIFQNNDSVWVKLTSNTACARPVATFSNKLKITITNTITPTVTISGNAPVCKGEALTLKAEGQNEGNIPVYNWYVNNALQNTIGNTFTSSRLQEKDSVYVTLTSDDACAQPAKVNSSKIKISVTDTIKPSVTLTGNTPVCKGSVITLTAKTTNKGANPVFDWFVNNVLQPAASPDSVFKSSALKNNDSVWVTLTSTAACAKPAKVTSVKSKIIVTDTIKPSVTISGNNLACNGSLVTIKASTLNGGLNPSFVWYLNNQPQNVTDSVFKSSQLQNKDSVWVKLTSKVACASPVDAFSNKAKITITNTIIPSVNITGNAPVCKGAMLVLNAQGQNAGTSSVYNWYINNVLQNTTGSTFTSAKFQEKDSVYVTLTSADACAQPAKVSSPKIKISVTDTIKPSVEITGNTPVCQGAVITLNAKTTNKGPNPVFEWYVNNVLQNTTTPDSVFKSSSLKNKDSVWVTLTSTGVCIKPAKVTSPKTVISVNDTIKPSVSIAGNIPICKGTNLTLTANKVNTGSNPVFKWYLNNVLQNNFPDSTFASSRLQNNDSIYVTITSDKACAKPAEAYSAKIGIAITDTVKPSVSISGPLSSCKGENITLEAQSVSEGSNPVFTWFVNGVQQNVISSSFAGTGFKNGDSVVVRLQSNLNCAVPLIVSSESFKVVIYDTLQPVITLTADSVFCIGEPVTVSSQINYGGINPAFSWFEGNNTLNNSNKDFSSVMAVGKHALTAILTSDEKCANPKTVNKTINILVKDSLILSPIITGDTVLCEGSEAYYNLINAGSLKNLSYNWIRNGALSGKTDSVLTISGLTNGETIALKVSGNEKCAVFLNSNTLSAEVTAAVIPKVDITASAISACPGESVVYKTQIVNPGINATYSWLQNNQPVANNEDSLVTTISPQTNVVLNYSTTLTCGIFNDSFAAPVIQIKESAPLLLYLSGPDTYCAGEAISFSTNKVENATYKWKYPSYAKASEKGNTILISLNENSNPDTLKVSAQNACGEGNEVSIPLRPKNCTTLFVPNAILSSDATGNNLWKIKGLEEYPDALVVVFNRWGMKVFSSVGYSEPWDGTNHGKELPTGTYYYVIEGVENKPLTGALTIVH